MNDVTAALTVRARGVGFCKVSTKAVGLKKVRSSVWKDGSKFGNVIYGRTLNVILILSKNRFRIHQMIQVIDFFKKNATIDFHCK